MVTALKNLSLMVKNYIDNIIINNQLIEIKKLKWKKFQMNINLLNQN